MKMTGAGGEFSGVVAKPNRHDVVLGRGNGIAGLLGNINYRRVIHKHRDQYNKATRNCKSTVASVVIEEISNLDPPGRFLVKNREGNFVVVSRMRAMEKTCQALREKKNKTPPDQTITSDTSSREDDSSIEETPKSRKRSEGLNHQSRVSPPRRCRIKSKENFLKNTFAHSKRCTGRSTRNNEQGSAAKKRRSKIPRKKERKEGKKSKVSTCSEQPCSRKGRFGAHKTYPTEEATRQIPVSVSRPLFPSKEPRTTMRADKCVIRIPNEGPEVVAARKGEERTAKREEHVRNVRQDQDWTRTSVSRLQTSQHPRDLHHDVPDEPKVSPLPQSDRDKTMLLWSAIYDQSGGGNCSDPRDNNIMCGARSLSTEVCELLQETETGNLGDLDNDTARASTSGLSTEGDAGKDDTVMAANTAVYSHSSPEDNRSKEQGTSVSATGVSNMDDRDISSAAESLLFCTENFDDIMFEHSAPPMFATFFGGMHPPQDIGGDGGRYTTMGLDDPALQEFMDPPALSDGVGVVGTYGHHHEKADEEAVPNVGRAQTEDEEESSLEDISSGQSILSDFMHQEISPPSLSMAHSLVFSDIIVDRESASRHTNSHAVCHVRENGSGLGRLASEFISDNHNTLVSSMDMEALVSKGPGPVNLAGEGTKATCIPSFMT